MLSIILLTLAVTALTSPLTIIAMRYQRRMAALQPQLAKLKAPEEKMKFLKEHGVSPLAGCLPTLLQAPIFILMFRHVRHVAAAGIHIGRIDLAQTGIAALSAGAPAALFIIGLITLTVAMGVFQARDTSGPSLVRWLPAAFGAWALALPLAVGVYYATSSVLRAALQWGVNRHFSA